MRIGVVSDTHIPEKAPGLPEKVVKDLKNVDMIIHAGDLTALIVIDMLKNICPNVKAVYGNMDPWEVREYLPEKEIIKVKNHRIGITHGHGHPSYIIDTITKTFQKDKVDIIIFGHSHQPLNEEKNGILFFNPGSLTDKIFAPYNSYGIIELNDTVEARIIKI
jgi:putative phosphoesterase